MAPLLYRVAIAVAEGATVFWYALWGVLIYTALFLALVVPLR